MNILNLDKITLQDHEVKLDGNTYKIPGSISLGTMFEMLENQQELEKEETFNVDLFKKSIKTIYDIFAIRQPDLDFNDFAKMLNMDRYTQLTSYILGLFGNTEESEKKTDDLKEE